MILLGLLAAAGLSAPPPANLTGLFRADDVPLEMLGEGEVDRTVEIRLTVRPDGHVQSCEVERSSGMRNLDIYTCKIAAGRAKFAPPTTQGGAPSYAVYRAPIRYLVTSGGPYSPRAPSADFIATVNQLPRGLKSPVAVHVTFEVDEQGHLSACKSETLPRTAEADPQLARLACDQLLKTYTAIPAKDEAGKTVPSVQDAIVAFMTK